MRKYEYNALLKAVDDLKEADTAFNHSYNANQKEMGTCDIIFKSVAFIT